MGAGATIVGAVGALLVFVVMTEDMLSRYNALVRLKNDVGKSWANIDVLLKQRNDEIPNLVKVVKGYAEHEREVLDNVTKARQAFINSATIQEKAAADNSITAALKSLFAVAENYPTLKANENFLRLQGRITGLENEIADRRELYNDTVNTYNIRIESLPDALVAKLMGLRRGQLLAMRKKTATQQKQHAMKPGS